MFVFFFCVCFAVISMHLNCQDVGPYGSFLSNCVDHQYIFVVRQTGCCVSLVSTRKEAR